MSAYTPADIYCPLHHPSSSSTLFNRPASFPSLPIAGSRSRRESAWRRLATPSSRFIPFRRKEKGERERSAREGRGLDNCSAAKERDSSTVVTLSARKGRGGDVCIHRPAVFRSNKSSRRVPPSFYRGREVEMPLPFNLPPPQPVFLYSNVSHHRFTIRVRIGGIFFTVAAPWNEI